MKVLIIGGVAAGTKVAAKLKREDRSLDVLILTKGKDISYAGCGLPYYVGGVIPTREQLIVNTPESFSRLTGAEVQTETEVTAVDTAAKTVTAVQHGETKTYSYDKLVIASGASPFRPQIEGLDLKNVFFMRTPDDAIALREAVEAGGIKRAVVAGGGFIGLEVAENLAEKGVRVNVIDFAPHVLPNFLDPEMSEYVENKMADAGVNPMTGVALEAVLGDGKVEKVQTSKRAVKADAVVIAIGIRPNTGFLEGTGIEMFRGTILTDKYMRTNVEDVYAVGDCATIYSNALQAETYIALATNAVRSGIVAGHNIGGTPLESIGVQGSNGISIFGYNMVSTGLSVSAAEKNGMKVSHTDYEDLQKPGFMKENAKVKIRIVYETESRRVVGAQMASTEDISMGIHMFSLAIEEGVTIDKLKLLDIFFLPHFNQPYNYITMAALNAK